MKKLSSDPGYCVSMLSELQKVQESTDVFLHSDGKSIPMHSAILSNCSQLLADLLASTGESKTLILPGYSAILSDFVSLVYTGLAPGLTKQKVQLLTSYCKELDIKTFDEDIENDNIVNVTSGYKHLTLETRIEFLHENFVLRMPMSRVDCRQKKSVKKPHMFEGFKRRIQKEYNMSPVGPYEGPFDQDPVVPLSAQLPRSQLSFQQYTDFIHSENIEYKLFKIKPNDKGMDTLDRIKLLKCINDRSDMFDEPDNIDKTFYTCNQNKCMIPCPCLTCSTNEEQCPDHKLKHTDLFDETDHAVSVRSTEHTCTSKYFFWRSYLLKYPGIPKDCPRCRKDLLNHKSYHIKFHWTCKFCKFYQYKLYPKSAKELQEREIQEEKWYKSVCPFCDTKFIGPYQRKKTC